MVRKRIAVEGPDISQEYDGPVFLRVIVLAIITAVSEELLRRCRDRYVYSQLPGTGSI